MTIKCPECKSTKIILHPTSRLSSAEWKQMSDGRFRATVSQEQFEYDEGDGLVSCADCTLEFDLSQC